MATISAGILMYRHGADGMSVRLVHPGGRIGATATLAPGQFRKAS